MEMGGFMEPGQGSSEPGETLRGAVNKLGISSSWGVRVSWVGQVVSTACQEHGVCCCLFFNHYVKLCIQQCLG